jgi:hypothetical protein
MKLHHILLVIMLAGPSAFPSAMAWEQETHELITKDALRYASPDSPVHDASLAFLVNEFPSLVVPDESRKFRDYTCYDGESPFRYSASMKTPMDILIPASSHPDKIDQPLLAHNGWNCVVPPWSTQQGRHAYFVDALGQHPSWAWGSADERAEFYYEKARKAFENSSSTGSMTDSLLGWTYLGFATHYVEDLGVPYHAGHLFALQPITHQIDNWLGPGECENNPGEPSNRAAGHDRFECDALQWLSQPGETYAPGDPVVFDAPGDYVRELARKSYNRGPDITWAYFTMDERPADFEQGRSSLENTTQALEWETERHVLGFWEHMFREFPELEATPPTTNRTLTGGSLASPPTTSPLQYVVRTSITNSDSWEVTFIVRLLSSTCQSFGCTSTPTAIASQSVTLAPGQTKEVAFTITEAQAATALSFLYDAVPVVGSGCVSLQGCVIEQDELTGNASAQAPSVLFVGLADLEVRPEGIQVRPTINQVLVDVSNVGTADAGQFQISLYSRHPNGSLTLLQESQVRSGLPAQQSVTVPMSYSGTMFSAVVRVDLTGTVPEVDDVGNNQASIVNWLIGDEQVIYGQPMFSDDIRILPGGRLILDKAYLHMNQGAQISIDAGGELIAIDSVIDPAVGASQYFFRSAGTISLENSSVSGITGGLRLGGNALILDAEISSLAGQPAVSAVQGVIRVVDSRLGGQGSGLVVGPAALVQSSNTTYEGRGGRALEVNGGQFSGVDDRFQTALTGVQVTAGGIALMDGAVIRPAYGWTSGSTLVGLDLGAGGGTVGLSNGQIKQANKGISGAAGRATILDSTLDATQNVAASGTLELRVTNSTIGSGATIFAGSSWMEVVAPVSLVARSAAPDLEPLPGTEFKAYNVQGQLAWNGTADENGQAQAQLLVRRFSAGGAPTSNPYRFEAQYNGPSTSVTASIPTGVVVLSPAVVKDVAVLGLNVTSTPTGERANALVANLQGATAPNVSLRWIRDGITLSTVSLGNLAPFAEVAVSSALADASGIHAIEAVVDPANSIVEQSEDNNSAKTDYWAVTGTETCSAPTSLSGSILLRSTGRLNVNCVLTMGTESGHGNLIWVPDGATLDFKAGSTLHASQPVSIAVQGTLIAANATLQGLEAIEAESAVIDIRDSELAAERSAIEAVDSAIRLERSSIIGTNLTSGIRAIGSTVDIEDSSFSQLLGYGVDLVSSPSPHIARSTFTNVSTALSLLNSSAIVEDSVMMDGVAQPFVSIASNPYFLNVTQDVENAWLAPHEVVEIAWHARFRVQGADLQPVSGATITVIDRAAQWVGQWDTGVTGSTITFPLLERQLRDINGDGRPTLVDESVRFEPYTLQSTGASSVIGLTGNVVATLGQSYKLTLSSPTPYLTMPVSSTSDFTVRVQNIGNGNDQLGLAVTPSKPGWSASIDPSSLSLGANQFTDVIVHVTSPGTNNDAATFNVTGTSEDGTTKAWYPLSAKTGANIPPAAQVTWSPSTAYVGETVTFNEVSNDADGWVASRTWSFDDGGQATTPTAIHQFSSPGSHVVTLAVKDNAGDVSTVISTFTVLNRAPILQEPRIAPAVADAGTPVVYQVVYRDLDGDAPQSVKAYVDGWAAPMSATGGSATTGITYQVTLANLTSGDHRVRFEGKDTAGATTLFPASYDLRGPLMNTKPTLSSLSVTPSAGTGATLFTFKATYKDLDDDAPAFIQVLVGDHTLNMSRTSTTNTYAMGVQYTASITLPATGTYTYTVQASDGNSNAMANGSGPTVSTTAALSQPSVTPPSGATTQVFRFDVIYQDAAGVAPSSVKVILDGQAHDMTVPTPADYVAGATFRYETSGLAPGTHSFHIEAVKGGVTTKLPTVGELHGPLVNTAPLPQLAMESIGTVATVFFADSAASSDAESAPELLEARMTWGDGNQTAWAKGRLHDHQFRSPGTYETYLEVRDPMGAVSVLHRPVTIVSSPPTAAFSVTPAAGSVSTSPTTGTQFLFRPGNSGDLEDPVDSLLGRWDWEGDGTPDTDWAQITHQFTHVYTIAKTYAPRLEVRDTSNQVSGVTHYVVVNGLRTLAWNNTVEDLMVQPGERHDYQIVLKNGIDTPDQVTDYQQTELNVDIVLNFPPMAGMNLDLFVQRNSLPNPSDCSATQCYASRSLASEGPEEVCMRLPPGGTYYISVVATGHTGTTPVMYDLLARENVIEARPAITTCMATGWSGG